MNSFNNNRSENEGDFVRIDADCLLVAKIDDVLVDCDVVVTLRRQNERERQDLVYHIYSGYLNSGVLFFKNNNRANFFVDLWIDQLINCIFYLSDQEALNRLVFRATDMTRYDTVFNYQGIRIKILRTDDYNFYYFDEESRNAKILHFKRDKRDFYDYYVKKTESVGGVY